jgi:hypothetical protein
MTDADVQFTHTDDATPYLLEKKTTTKGIAKFEKQRLILFSDCIIFVAKKKVGKFRALVSACRLCRAGERARSILLLCRFFSFSPSCACSSLARANAFARARFVFNAYIILCVSTN